MQLISLIRHGQAGSRDDYDRLSETGRRQAQLLGKWLIREEIRFDAAIVGGLRRQRETAEIVLAGLTEAGLAPSRVIEDAQWSEFDIDSVFKALAPLLAARDERFRDGYEKLLAAMRNGEGGVHREWTPVDTQVVESWIAGEFETGVESWRAFNERVRAALEGVPPLPRVAVFTSATPAAICVSHCFGTADAHRIMHLAGAAINTNITTVVRRNGFLGLGGFNHVPHLEDRRLRTFR